MRIITNINNNPLYMEKKKQHTELFNELPWITGWWDFTLEVTKELNIFIPKWQKLQIAHITLWCFLVS